MAVNTTIALRILLAESSAEDLGTAVKAHLLEFPGTLGTGEYTTGTADNKFDRVWSDTRTLAATSEQLDVLASLTASIGGAAISFVEVSGIYIKNKATTNTSILSVGGGANPAFAGLFGATGDIIKVPASGVLLWFAPLDGGGLVPVAGTGDMITVDAGAATVTYDICIWGRSA